MSEKNTLLQKMLAVTQEVQNIEKKGWNEFSKYEYVRAVDVVAGVQKSLAKNKIYLSITEEAVEYATEKPAGKNNFARIKCRASFIDIENPSEKIEVTYFAEAADTLDKAIYKAKTGGLKYLLTQQFFLVTDALADPEQESKKEEKKETKAELPRGDFAKAEQKIKDASTIEARSALRKNLAARSWESREREVLEHLISEKENNLKDEIKF